MTRIDRSFWWMTVTLTACVARGQVTVTYAPTTLEPGVATPITIDVTDSSGAGLDISFVALRFEQTDGLVLSGFSWLVADFDDPQRWFSSVVLPAPQAVAFGADTISIAPDATLALATVTVTATAAAAGTTQTLTVFPDDPQSDATIGDAMGASVEIMAGRSVDLTVSGDAGDAGAGGGSDGSGGSGGGGGGGGDAGGSPPDGGGQDTGGGGAGDGSGADAGMDVGDVMDEVIDGGPDVDPGADAGGGAGGGMGDAGAGDAAGDGGTGGGVDDGAADGASGADGDGATPDGSAPSDGGAGATTPVCGIGMIGPGLFTLCGLSVIKLNRRRWRRVP